MSARPTCCRRCATGPLGIAWPGAVHHMGRGLCPDCYVWAWRAGCLDEYPSILPPGLPILAVHERPAGERGSRGRGRPQRVPLSLVELAKLRAQVGLPAVLPPGGVS